MMSASLMNTPTNAFNEAEALSQVFSGYYETDKRPAPFWKNPGVKFAIFVSSLVVLSQGVASMIA